jgi:putative membrane protein insertion efficiency factor
MKKLLIALVKAWRAVFSPLYPPSCRYYPSCSEYAILSIEKHGALKGSLKAIWRLLRCNPFSKGGVDLP